MQERWKGVRPILWGDTLREADLSYWLFNSLLGYQQLPAQVDSSDLTTLAVDAMNRETV